MRYDQLALVMTAFAVLALHATAVPIQWSSAAGGNDHYYEIVLTDSDWFDANTEAATRQFNGLQGHLATITSQAEDQFIYDNFISGTDGNFWIGLTDEITEDLYQWVTGETSSYFNWGNGGEPNNTGHIFQDEDYIRTWTNPGLIWSDYSWNDTDGGTGYFLIPYLVEYGTFEDPDDPDVIPEPMTLGLVGLGLASMGLVRRRPKPRHD